LKSTLITIRVVDAGAAVLAGALVLRGCGCADCPLRIPTHEIEGAVHGRLAELAGDEATIKRLTA
jgi:hypothetical protein